MARKETQQVDSVVWQGSHMVGVGMEHRVVEQLVCWIKHGTEYAECTYQSPQSITVGRGVSTRIFESCDWLDRRQYRATSPGSQD